MSASSSSWLLDAVARRQAQQLRIAFGETPMSSSRTVMGPAYEGEAVDFVREHPGELPLLERNETSQAYVERLLEQLKPEVFYTIKRAEFEEWLLEVSRATEKPRVPKGFRWSTFREALRYEPKRFVIDGYRAYDVDCQWSPDGGLIEIETSNLSTSGVILNAATSFEVTRYGAQFRPGHLKTTFSSDGKYLAYSILRGEAIGSLIIVSVHGREEFPVSEAIHQDGKFAWAPTIASANVLVWFTDRQVYVYDVLLRIGRDISAQIAEASRDSMNHNILSISWSPTIDGLLVVNTEKIIIACFGGIAGGFVTNVLYDGHDRNDPTKRNVMMWAPIWSRDGTYVAVDHRFTPGNDDMWPQPSVLVFRLVIGKNSQGRNVVLNGEQVMRREYEPPSFRFTEWSKIDDDMLFMHVGERGLEIIDVSTHTVVSQGMFASSSMRIHQAANGFLFTSAVSIRRLDANNRLNEVIVIEGTNVKWRFRPPVPYGRVPGAIFAAFPDGQRVVTCHVPTEEEWLYRTDNIIVDVWKLSSEGRSDSHFIESSIRFTRRDLAMNNAEAFRDVQVYSLNVSKQGDVCMLVTLRRRWMVFVWAESYWKAPREPTGDRQ